MANKKTATWNDIEVALNDGTLDDKDQETLEAYNRVEPPTSKNPSFRMRFNDAKGRIRHRLSVLAERDRPTPPRGSGNGLGRWYVDVSRLVREIRRKAIDAQKSRSKTTVATIKNYLAADHEALSDVWPEELPVELIGTLGRHIGFGQAVDFRDILQTDLPAIEQAAEKHFLSSTPSSSQAGFENLLHPAVRRSSLAQYRQGHYRDAVLNAVIGVFDHLRKATGATVDGAKLVNEVLGGASPKLIFSEMETESGRNDQAGFHKIFLGTYEGIRNPKAHSLDHDLDATKAAQYLVFASLLARRIDECRYAG